MGNATRGQKTPKSKKQIINSKTVRGNGNAFVSGPLSTKSIQRSISGWDLDELEKEYNRSGSDVLGSAKNFKQTELYKLIDMGF